MASEVMEDSEISSVLDSYVKKSRRKKHGKVVTSTPLSVSKQDPKSSRSQQSISTPPLFEVTGGRFANVLTQLLCIEKSWKSEFAHSTSAFIRFGTTVLRACRAVYFTITRTRPTDQMSENADTSKPLLDVILLMRQGQLEQAKKLSQGKALTESFQRTSTYVNAMEQCQSELQALVNRLLALITLDDFNSTHETNSPRCINSALSKKSVVFWPAIISTAGDILKQLAQDALLRNAILAPEGLRCLCAADGKDIHRVAALWKHSGSLISWSTLTVPVQHLLSTSILK